MSPLNPVVIEAWARQTHRNPTAQEYEALLLLDSVLRDPEIGPKD